MRVDLPLDATRQVARAVALLGSPPTPDAQMAAALDMAVLLEQRTRVLAFGLPRAHPRPR